MNQQENKIFVLGKDHLISKSITTLSVFGCDWHVRIYPFFTSSSSNPQCTSIITSPFTNLALQVQHTPPLQANGRSAPCCKAASNMVVLLLSERLKSKLLPSSFTVILLFGPSL